MSTLNVNDVFSVGADDMSLFSKSTSRLGQAGDDQSVYGWSVSAADDILSDIMSRVGNGGGSSVAGGSIAGGSITGGSVAGGSVAEGSSVPLELSLPPPPPPLEIPPLDDGEECKSESGEEGASRVKLTSPSERSALNAYDELHDAQPTPAFLLHRNNKLSRGAARHLAVRRSGSDGILRPFSSNARIRHQAMQSAMFLDTIPQGEEQDQDSASDTSNEEGAPKLNLAFRGRNPQWTRDASLAVDPYAVRSEDEQEEEENEQEEATEVEKREDSPVRNSAKRTEQETPQRQDDDASSVSSAPFEQLDLLTKMKLQDDELMELESSPGTLRLTPAGLERHERKQMQALVDQVEMEDLRLQQHRNQTPKSADGKLESTSEEEVATKPSIGLPSYEEWKKRRDAAKFTKEKLSPLSPQRHKLGEPKSSPIGTTVKLPDLSQSIKGPDFLPTSLSAPSTPPHSFGIEGDKPHPVAFHFDSPVVTTTASSSGASQEKAPASPAKKWRNLTKVNSMNKNRKKRVAVANLALLKCFIAKRGATKPEEDDEASGTEGTDEHNVPSLLQSPGESPASCQSKSGRGGLSTMSVTPFAALEEDSRMDLMNAGKARTAAATNAALQSERKKEALSRRERRHMEEQERRRIERMKQRELARQRELEAQARMEREEENKSNEARRAELQHWVMKSDSEETKVTSPSTLISSARSMPQSSDDADSDASEAAEELSELNHRTSSSPLLGKKMHSANDIFESPMSFSSKSVSTKRSDAEFTVRIDNTAAVRKNNAEGLESDEAAGDVTTSSSSIPSQPSPATRDVNSPNDPWGFSPSGSKAALASAMSVSAPPLTAGDEDEDDSDEDDDDDMVVKRSASEPVPVVSAPSPRGEALCVKCHCRPQTNMAVPCMHFCLCSKCGDEFRAFGIAECPICNAGQVSFSQIYVAI